MSLSDQMLAGGCALHVEALHGEPVKILTGPLAGQVFIAVRETQTDDVLTTDLGIDPRAKRILRFRDPAAPALGLQDRLQTEDGKIWTAVRRPDEGYLTTDFELQEVTAQDQ